jgi:hypothetical protein
MRLWNNRILYACLAVSLSPTALAEKFAFKSSGIKAQLVELHTSQGCSSCPPAEHLLSTQLQSNRLWKEIVPIAFHVDYWDYLGWKDIYAQASFTERQQKHFQLGNISNVYTPGFVVDGREWRGFFRTRDIPKTQEMGGSLTLNWDSESHSAQVSYQQAVRQPKFCYVAVLGFEQGVAIQAGENKGLKVNQDFVALQVRKTEIEKSGASYHCQAVMDIKMADLAKNTRALVSWITDSTEQPLQATGGWL